MSRPDHEELRRNTKQRERDRSVAKHAAVGSTPLAWPLPSASLLVVQGGSAGPTTGTLAGTRKRQPGDVFAFGH